MAETQTQTDTNTDTFRNGIGIGVLASQEDDVRKDIQSNGTTPIHGVAIPENTILKGGQDVEYFFSPEMAERAAEVLQQQIKDGTVHVVKNFHEIDGQASADEILGEVTDAGYSKGVGVVFEGEITDMEIAQKIQNGYLDVSPSVARALGGFDETMQARGVTDVAGFRDIAVVGNGQPGAEVNIGPNPAVSTLSRDVLNRVFDTDTLEEEQETEPEDDVMTLDEAKEKLAEEYGIDADTLDERLSESDETETDENVVTLIEAE